MNLKLWRFSDPDDDRFARASRRGTWDHGHRVSPLVIEWEPDSDVVGDFVWPGLDSDIVVTEKVYKALASRFSGFEPEDGGLAVTLPPASVVLVSLKSTV